MADQQHTPKPIGWVRIIAVPVVALVLFAVRHRLVASGRVYGEAKLRLLTLLVAGLFLFFAVLIVGLHNFTALVAAVGAAAAVFAGVELYAPSDKDAAAPAACPGAQVHNVKMLARTHPNGTNVRSGPGRTYPILSRFQPDCTVGFVGYCLGEPELDLFYQSNGFEVRDMRWLQLPGGRGLVHAGVVATQGVDETLPHIPCKDEAPMPPAPKVTVDFGTATRASGVVTVRAVAANAATIGFASYAEVHGRPLLTRLALDADATDDFAVAWDVAAQRTPGGRGRGPVTVVAVVCLAGEVPSDAATAVDLFLRRPVSTAVRKTHTYERLDADLQRRIRRKACLLPEVSPKA